MNFDLNNIVVVVVPSLVAKWGEIPAGEHGASSNLGRSSSRRTLADRLPALLLPKARWCFYMLAALELAALAMELFGPTRIG